MTCIVVSSAVFECCSVLQCVVAVCCKWLCIHQAQVFECCSVLQCVAVCCCSVLQVTLYTSRASIWVPCSCIWMDDVYCCIHLSHLYPFNYCGASFTSCDSNGWCVLLNQVLCSSVAVCCSVLLQCVASDSVYIKRKCLSHSIGWRVLLYPFESLVSI